MSGYRPSYTSDEDTKILELIIKSQAYYMLRGVKLWKDLSAVGDFDRTWMSLKNRFEKYILPDLSNPRLKIPELEKRKIELSWYQTSAAAAKQFKSYSKNKNGSSTDSSSCEEISDGDEETTKHANCSNDDTDIQENTSTPNLNESFVFPLPAGDHNVNSPNFTHNDPNAHSPSNTTAEEHCSIANAALCESPTFDSEIKKVTRKNNETFMEEEEIADD